jgi:hypothetical protein
VSIESRELLFAQLAEKFVNWGIRAPKEPAKITDFMPSRWAARAGVQPRSETSGAPVRMTAWRRREVAKGWREFMSTGFAGYTTVESVEVPPKS